MSDVRVGDLVVERARTSSQITFRMSPGRDMIPGQPEGVTAQCAARVDSDSLSSPTRSTFSAPRCPVSSIIARRRRVDLVSVPSVGPLHIVRPRGRTQATTRCGA